MEYKFKVGDYVRRKDGEIGYISSMDINGFHWSIHKSLTDGVANYYRYSEDYSGYFDRIGEYDFTKEDNKIKKINWSGDIVNGEVLYFEMSNIDLLWKLTNKVNEIIDCLNKEENINDNNTDVEN